ncbi:hypothetical protein ANN_20795 [Periplaneta americana]|uniref:Beta-glucuronidase n=1 Tax=Periplaneta americana TaxID=6978 RepID=A0ABQ8SDM4_PERAM|nr:hypothetical protein ANN_20795 [Periplaneta americana]
MIISMAWRRWAKNACLYATLVGVIMVPIATAEGILYPIESESRTTHLLDGVWDFRLADPADSAIGHREGWYKQQLRLTGGTIPMPVPSSYNDITEDKEVRDHVGVVWYDRTFYAPKSWSTDNLRVWLRFGGVHYAAQVFLNGGMVLSHSGGHVPFQIEVTSELKYGDKNLISVAVNNTLTDITVPQGQVNELATDNGTKIVQGYTFDFFNYAGIHRSVVLYTTPISYIDDIDVSTDINGDTGIITYKVTAGENPSGTPEASVSLVDRDGNYVIQDVAGLEGKLEVPQAKLWWPFLMDTDPAYLYTLEVRLTTDSGVSADVYRLPVGIRKVEWNNTAVTINGKPIYIRGFGRHEDSDIRGKGHDFPLIVRDYNLIKWLGANAYRTSHYPYSEEIMDFADKEGIMIIDECPGVNIGGYGFKDELLSAHKAALTTLYKRDKNRPSVIMWSVANEALTANTGADTYFRFMTSYTNTSDKFHPVPSSQHCTVATILVTLEMRLTGFLEFGKDAATLPPRGFDGSLSILLNEGCDWLLTGEDKISVTVRKTFIYDNQLVWGSRSAVAEHIKSLDSSRPITMAMSASYSGDKAGEFMDVIGFNRYNSWYSNGGRTDTIIPNVMSEARDWFTKYNKPIIMTEYGADTMPGLHISPEYIWSEEYQVTVLSKHFEAFDNLMKEGFFIGEMIWNFADFNTAQRRRKGVEMYSEVTAANSWIANKKGLSTSEWISSLKMTANLAAVRSVPGRSFDGTCTRYGCPEIETLAHVLVFCEQGLFLRNSRHHLVRSKIAAALRNKGWIVEEEISCLPENGSTKRVDILAYNADTKQGIIVDPTIPYTRVGGNKKGVFTRERQPKASAHLLRKRYWAVAQELDNATPPSDLDEYIISPKSKKSLRNEL